MTIEIGQEFLFTRSYENVQTDKRYTRIPNPHRDEDAPGDIVWFVDDRGKYVCISADDVVAIPEPEHDYRGLLAVLVGSLNNEHLSRWAWKACEEAREALGWE
jgi:hypothetical protein